MVYPKTKGKHLCLISHQLCHYLAVIILMFVVDKNINNRNLFRYQYICATECLFSGEYERVRHCFFAAVFTTYKIFGAFYFKAMWSSDHIQVSIYFSLSVLQSGHIFENQWFPAFYDRFKWSNLQILITGCMSTGCDQFNKRDFFFALTELVK